MTFLLCVAVILIATLPAQSNGSTAYPCSGTWNGTLSPGTGTVSVLGTNHQISTSSVVSGTFDGDTTHGNWVGTISTNYTVPDMSTKGQVSSAITGTYVMSIDPSGTITGTSTIPLTGGFSGQLKITFQGTESQTGGLTGTWTGTLTVTQVTYVGMPLGANITAPGSGQFTGTAQTSAAQTVASTSSAIPTSVTVASTTAAASSATTMVSPTSQSVSQPSGQGVSPLPYALVAVVVIIIIVAALALKMRRPKKSSG